MSERDTRLVERQQRRELDAVSTGIERYRTATRKADENGLVADTKPGLRVLTAIMPFLIEAINEARTEASQGFGGGARNISSWWMPILSLAPEKMAYITIRTALSSRGDHEVRMVARMVGQRCETERALDLFKETEAAREKAMEEAGHERPENVYKLMCQYADEVNPRTFKRWRQKVEDFDARPWGEDAQVTLGMKLLHMLVEQGGGWFQVRTVRTRDGRRGMKTTKLLEMTPEGEAFLADQRDLEEVNRPWLVPMISKPVPWEAV